VFDRKTDRDEFGAWTEARAVEAVLVSEPDAGEEQACPGEVGAARLGDGARTRRYDCARACLVTEPVVIFPEPPALTTIVPVMDPLTAMAQWAAQFAGTDACVTPVLSCAEGAADPHLTARHTLIEADGVVQAASAPRFSRRPPRSRIARPLPTASASEVV
jgi:hypothetical protein